MVTDLTLNRERIRNFKITNDENEFGAERSILPAGEMKGMWKIRLNIFLI